MSASNPLRNLAGKIQDSICASLFYGKDLRGKKTEK